VTQQLLKISQILYGLLFDAPGVTGVYMIDCRKESSILYPVNLHRALNDLQLPCSQSLPPHRGVYYILVLLCIQEYIYIVSQ